jgi:8-oxo-dGTP pyrophosphatase MutT (NUDIX family)
MSKMDYTSQNDHGHNYGHGYGYGYDYSKTYDYHTVPATVTVTPPGLPARRWSEQRPTAMVPESDDSADRSDDSTGDAAPPRSDSWTVVGTPPPRQSSPTVSASAAAASASPASTSTSTSTRGSVCNNCGGRGHLYYQCKKPLTSNGIIAYKKEADGIYYLMVCRKHTFGFVDFVRGKYMVNDRIHLQTMIDEMTVSEKQMLLTSSYDELWCHLWSVKSVKLKTNNQAIEKSNSEKKFTILRQGVFINHEMTYNLETLVGASQTTWMEPEWGFPKGKKNYREQNYECAVREWEEETGQSASTITHVANMNPYEEIFMGSNYKIYKNLYYVFRHNGTECPASGLRTNDKYEISKVRWLRFDRCLNTMRHYNQEKKRILINLNITLNNYDCF